MTKVSWILLTVITCLFLLGSLASLWLAYLAAPSDDVVVGGTSVADLALAPDVVTALRGRRGTAASLGLAFGTLLLSVILGPYRAGERWAWHAIFRGFLVFAFAAWLRVPLLGTWLGADIASILFVLVLIALLLDISRLRQPRV